LIVMTLVTTLMTPPMLRLLSRPAESPQRTDA